MSTFDTTEIFYIVLGLVGVDISEEISTLKCNET